MSPTETKYNDSRRVLIQDCILSILASILSLLLVRWLSDPIPGFTSILLWWVGCALAASLLGFLATRSFRHVRRFATIRSLANVSLAVVIKELLLTPVLVLLLRRIPEISPMMITLNLLADLVISCVFLLYIRFAARLFSSTGDESINAVVGKKNVLVAGTGPASLATAFEAELTGIYNVVGLLTKDRLMSGCVIDDWLVFFCETRHDVDILQWKLGGVDAILFPNEAHCEGQETGIIPHDLPQDDGMNAAGRFIKRGFDATASFLLLLLFSPLIGLCALAVRLEDGGPVFYAQERVGMGGETFRIFKFRSMKTDAEAGGSPQLYSGDDDPRLTRVGRFLRNHHLDELPQLWNVLRGDMSLIGHRPERPYYISQIMQRNPRYRYLYQIRPGVTSYATLYNGYADTLEKMLVRLDLDLYYLRNRTVLFDIRVLALTFFSIIFGKRF